MRQTQLGQARLHMPVLLLLLPVLRRALSYPLQALLLQVSATLRLPCSRSRPAAAMAAAAAAAGGGLRAYRCHQPLVSPEG
jgi:hypothetical protein